MHCKDVSIRDVDFSLTKESIDSQMKDWNSYTRTEYMVFRNDDRYAVVHFLSKEKSTSLFKKVNKFKILALPDDIIYIEIPDLDVLNVPALAKIQQMHPNKGIVVKGMFSHVVFIKDLEPLYLHIVDNIPPSPAKLTVLVQKALDSGFIDYPIIPVEHIIDMDDSIGNANTESIMFPCKVSGLKGGRRTYYLDEAPDIEEDVTLIGCHLSKRIFESIYGKEPDFINVCPADFTEGKRKCIVKCCKIKNDHVINDEIAQVPWGATVPEVVDAINDLFKD